MWKVDLKIFLKKAGKSMALYFAGSRAVCRFS